MNKEDKRTYDIEYRQKNREKIKERTKEYYKIHHQQRLEYKKQWLEKNPGYNKKYYQKHKEKILKNAEKYKKENSEYYKKYIKEWRKRNPEYGKAHHLANRERELEQVKKWGEKNIGHRKEYKKEYLQTEGKMTNQKSQYMRRAKMRKLINNLPVQEWLDILEKYNYVCAYCGIEFDCENLPTKDHIIPIDKGGHTVKENIVPACKSCNSKKNNKLIYELKEAI